MPGTLLPKTVFCAISGMSAKSTLLAFSVTHPSVTVKSPSSNAATPKSACVIRSVCSSRTPHSLQVYFVIYLLLGLTSPFTITSGLIAAVATLLPLLVNTTSPVTVGLS